MSNLESSRRPRRSREAWQSLVEELEGSGLNRQEFANAHQVSYHRLGYWQRKLRQESGIDRESPPVFVEVPRPSEAQTDKADWDVELSLGSDILLRLKAR